MFLTTEEQTQFISDAAPIPSWMTKLKSISNLLSKSSNIIGHLQLNTAEFAKVASKLTSLTDESVLVQEFLSKNYVKTVAQNFSGILENIPQSMSDAFMLLLYGIEEVDSTALIKVLSENLMIYHNGNRWRFCSSLIPRILFDHFHQETCSQDKVDIDELVQSAVLAMSRSDLMSMDSRKQVENYLVRLISRFTNDTIIPMETTKFLSILLYGKLNCILNFALYEQVDRDTYGYYDSYPKFKADTLNETFAPELYSLGKQIFNIIIFFDDEKVRCEGTSANISFSKNREKAFYNEKTVLDLSP